ncbi:hypothetical protein FQN49_002793 [Arthroderma sp. PD_2]|nr:hypothetical protein FQN49_002793 [Arthroderma sp. PD_2]
MPSIGEKSSSAGQLPRRKDLFLFSHIRTASNLLYRLLSNQPGWTQSKNHFTDAFLYAKECFNWGAISSISDEERRHFEHLLQQGYDGLKQMREAAVRENKSVFYKCPVIFLWEPSSLYKGKDDLSSATPFTLNSLSTNPTILPDDFLTSWQPLLLIRHPAIVFESWYRAECRTVGEVGVNDPSWSLFTSFQYSRQLYDWFESKEPTGLPEDGSSKPLVIDSDDIIESTSLDKLCELCGMDPTFLLYEWEATEPPSDASPRWLGFMTGLASSTSIDRSKSSRGIDITARHSQWKDEFGVLVADALFERVNEAMEDYNYLKSRKI